MTTTRTLATLAVLPIITAAGHGIAAAAPGQPGLAVPGDGQPGLSTTPPPPSPPSLADNVPDPPAPPARPRPQQQLNPPFNALPAQPEPNEEEPAVTSPEIVLADPHILRVGNTTMPIPDQIDSRTRLKAQAYLDYIEWQVAAGYDTIGFSHDESDRRAASTLTGALVGGVAGAEMVSVPAAFAGCGIGSVVGGIAGGALGGAAAGIGLPFGAGVGAGAGCLAGLATAAVSGIGIGATAGAVIGGAAVGALGAAVDIPEPASPPPLIEVSTPAQEAPPPLDDPLTHCDRIIDNINGFIANDPIASSLRSAIATLPPLTPNPS
ncbi:hypothetical protein [Nocardia tengchongensis]|uniref:hypothetical protein n=1 Tax=Nocardia tengchongensis TaxID=2055889 RepID=UPI0036245040